MSERYEAKAIEEKWQRVWDGRAPGGREPRLRRRHAAKSYVVEMLPYPSGSLHLGHLLVYTIGDVTMRFRRRNGLHVLHPMGWDAFGLPAENNAIKQGAHPRPTTERNIENIRRSMRRMAGGSTGRASLDARPALLPLAAVAVPALPRAGVGLPQGSAREVVPERPDRARERAGAGRRHLRVARWSSRA